MNDRIMPIIGAAEPAALPIGATERDIEPTLRLII